MAVKNEKSEYTMYRGRPPVSYTHLHEFPLYPPAFL